MKEMFFYNDFHLGDCLWALDFLQKLSKLNDLKIVFYCKKEYHFELNFWLDDNRIIIEDLNKKNNKAINCWINTFGHHDRRNDYGLNYDLVYLAFYKQLCENLKMKNPIVTAQEFLFDNEKIIKAKIELKEFDYLIVNSKGFSAQWNYNENDFNKLFEKMLRNNKKVITTFKTKFSEIPCSLDYNLNLLEISKLSINCKNIIGVHTAPMAAPLNIWNIDKNFIIFHNMGFKYSFKSQNIKNSNAIMNIEII